MLVNEGERVSVTLPPTIFASNVPRDESVLTSAYSVRKTFVPLCVNKISCVWYLLSESCSNCTRYLHDLNAVAEKLSMT